MTTSKQGFEDVFEVFSSGLLDNRVENLLVNVIRQRNSNEPRIVKESLSMMYEIQKSVYAKINMTHKEIVSNNILERYQSGITFGLLQSRLSNFVWFGGRSKRRPTYYDGFVSRYAPLVYSLTGGIPARVPLFQPSHGYLPENKCYNPYAHPLYSPTANSVRATFYILLDFLLWFKDFAGKYEIEGEQSSVCETLLVDEAQDIDAFHTMIKKIQKIRDKGFMDDDVMHQLEKVIVARDKTEMQTIIDSLNTIGALANDIEKKARVKNHYFAGRFSRNSFTRSTRKVFLDGGALYAATIVSAIRTNNKVDSDLLCKPTKYTVHAALFALFDFALWLEDFLEKEPAPHEITNDTRLYNLPFINILHPTAKHKHNTNILVLGLGGESDIVGAAAVATALKQQHSQPNALVAYGGVISPQSDYSGFEKMGPHLFRREDGQSHLDRERGVLSLVLGMKEFDAGLPAPVLLIRPEQNEWNDSAKYVSTVQQAFQNSLDMLNPHYLILVDMGGDSLFDDSDVRMLCDMVKNGTHLVLGPGCNGKYTMEMIQDAVAKKINEDSFLGSFDLSSFIDSWSDLSSELLQSDSISNMMNSAHLAIKNGAVEPLLQDSESEVPLKWLTTGLAMKNKKR